jgi:hypothetical protein
MWGRCAGCGIMKWPAPTEIAMSVCAFSMDKARPCPLRWQRFHPSPFPEGLSLSRASLPAHHLWSGGSLRTFFNRPSTNFCYSLRGTHFFQHFQFVHAGPHFGDDSFDHFLSPSIRAPFSSLYQTIVLFPVPRGKPIRIALQKPR